uniref:ORF8 n=1 Tax=Carrot yellow leaf virus TaxID=656190 RepID=A0A0A0P5L1_9CLOS|nr:ORF8 [Carrot yellow leaf virus]
MPENDSNDSSNKGALTQMPSKLSSVSISDKRLLTGAVKDAAKIKFFTGITAKYPSINIADTNTHLGMLLHGYAIRTTSKQASEPEGEFVNYTLGETEYSFTEKDYLNIFDSIPRITGNNKPRVFCRSFATEYLDFFLKNSSTLPNNPRALSQGLPPGYHYLAADFLDACDKLTLHEAAAAVKAKDHALASKQVADQFVANVYEIGKH